MVITISREFGSGGKYIGEQLAKNLNLKFYDKEIIEILSKEENIDIDFLKNIDESSKNSFWNALAVAYMVNPTDSINSFVDLPMADQYFIKTVRLIEKIAKEDNCVIIGRCSNIILKDYPNVINFFIYSSNQEFKINRKKEFANLEEKKAIRLIQKKDKDRAAYYHYYTNEKWGDRSGYDLLVDSSKLGVDGTIELLEQYVKSKTK